MRCQDAVRSALQSAGSVVAVEWALQKSRWPEHRPEDVGRESPLEGKPIATLEALNPCVRARVMDFRAIAA